MPRRVQNLDEDGNLASDYFLEDGFDPTEQEQKQIEQQTSLGSIFKDLGKELFNRPGALIKDIGNAAIEEFKPSSDFLDTVGHYSGITPLLDKTAPFRESFMKGMGDIGSFAKGAVTHPIDTAEAVLKSPFESALRGTDQLIGGLAGAPEGMPIESGPYIREYAPDMVPGGTEGLKAGLKVGLPLAAPGSEIFAHPLGNLAEGNIQEGAGELAALGIGGALLHRVGSGVLKGTGLGEFNLGENLTSPGNAEAALGVLDKGLGAPGTSNILSKGRYMRPGETEPVNPELGGSFEGDPFRTGDKKLLENESLQDLWDVLRRGEDVLDRAKPEVVPSEQSSTLKDVEFDPRFNAANRSGDISMNLRAIAERANSPEEFLDQALRTLGHEKIHEEDARPHGIALVDEAANRVMQADEPKASDIELGQTQFPEGESVAYSKTEPYQDLEGNYVKEPTEADFSFRTADEALENATSGPLKDLINEYMSNPNDKATLSNAFEILKGERRPNAEYRDLIPSEGENLSEIRKVSYRGQDYEIVSRKGNAVRIRDAAGKEKVVGFSELDKPKIKASSEPPKSKYADLIDELEGLNPPEETKPILDDITLDPKDVSLVADPLEDFPEVKKQKGIDDAFARSVKKVQAQDKEAAKLQKEIEGAQKEEIKGQEETVPDEGEHLKEAAKLVPQIEKAQAAEEIRDQPFKDKILLQDKILRGQEQEALKAGKAEDAQKASLERKILRAQNEEVFKAHKEELKKNLAIEKEKGKLTKQIVKAQEAEDFAAAKKANPTIKPKEKSSVLLDVLGLPRSLMTSVDLSGAGRQGLPLISRPEVFGAFKEQLKSFVSKEAHERVKAEIEAMPHRQLMEDSGLKFTQSGSVAEMGGREEAFPSKFAEKIPLVAGSERAYSTYLNKLRADVFSNITDKLQKAGEQDPETFKALATYINNATGRASLGSAEKFAPAANAVFFSPRLQASRLKLMAGLADPSVPMSVRKEMYRDLVGTTVGVGLTMAALAQIGGAKVNTDDPRKSDFLRPTWGNTSVDLGGSFLPWITLGAKLVSGNTIEKGQVRDLNTPGFNKGHQKAKSTTGDVLARFARGKLAPIPSILADVVTGKNYSGEDTDALKSIGEHSLPMGLKDEYDLWNTEDVPSDMKPVLAALGLIGAGVNTRKPPKQKGIKF